MRCLALDMSVHVGWIAFSRPGELAGIGTWHLPDNATLGERLLYCQRWVVRQCRTYRPDIVAFEEPIRGVPWRRSGIEMRTTMATLKLLQGIAFAAEVAAAECEIERCIEVSTSTAKKKLAGHGRADKHQMKHAAVLAGVPIADEHQADALAVALCAYEHCGVPVRGHDGPLLATLSRW